MENVVSIGIYRCIYCNRAIDAIGDTSELGAFAIDAYCPCKRESVMHVLAVRPTSACTPTGTAGANDNQPRDTRASG